MAEITGGRLVGRLLTEEGVDFIAGVHGGHVWPLLNGTGEQKIKMIHVRHEQTGVYIADGWARTSRRPGVCFGTAGPGMLNMVAGIAHSYACRSPVVALFGQHETYRDGQGPLQEAYAEEVCKSITKWTKRVTDARTISYYIQKAFRDAQAYPPGPVGIELGQNILYHAFDDARQVGYLPRERCARLCDAEAEPATVGKIVRMLIEAERPVVISGDGVYWAQAAQELKELVELLNVPVHTRRMGRGAVPESHPLAFSGGYRRSLLDHADVILVFGLRMNMLEHFGEPPTYSHDAKYILVSESMEDLEARLPTEIRLHANPKLVLGQMINYAKDLIKDSPARTEWIGEVRKTKEAYTKDQREQVEKWRYNRPLNPHVLAQDVADFLDDSATVILDSFSMAGFITDKIQAKFAGQVMDAGTDGGVGHSIGMGIGAQLARPGKQVLALLGDGGVGVAGFDIETAARYKIPVAYLLFNNSGWISTELQKHVLPIPEYSWGILPNIRYDKIFEEQGCHGELVTDIEQLRPALDRAFNSGKPAVINVIPDTRIIPPQFKSRITERL